MPMLAPRNTLVSSTREHCGSSAWREHIRHFCCTAPWLCQRPPAIAAFRWCWALRSTLPFDGHCFHSSGEQSYVAPPSLHADTERLAFASVLPVATPPKAIDVWSCRRGAASFVADNSCGRGRVHRISIAVVFGIPVSLQPSVELEVSHCTEFLLGRSRAEPESAQFRRVWSMDRTICPSRRVVHNAALQQIIFNVDRCAFECVFRDQGQTTKVSFSSQNLISILDKYVPEWMGEDAIDGLCFHPPKVQSYACFDLPMNRVGFPRSSRMIFAECESSNTHR